MKLIEHSTGGDICPPFGNKYWVSDDPAMITFGSKNLTEPVVIIAAVAGHSGIVRQATVKISLEKLTYLASAKFAGATDVRIKDFGNCNVQSCVAYAMYRLDDFSKDGSLVLIRTSGLGVQCFIVDGSSILRTMQIMIQTHGDFNVMLWDLCDAISGSYGKGWNDGRAEKQHEMSVAYIEGRLRKRTKRGSVYVDIKSRPIVPDADGVTRVTIDLRGSQPGLSN
jgi:hypothetical protein